MILFNTIKPFYLSQHKIEIGATVSTADLVALEVVIDNNVVGNRLHIKPVGSKVLIDIQSMVHAALLESYQSFVVLGDFFRVRKPVVVKVRAALVANGTTGTFADSNSFKVMLGAMELHTLDFYSNLNSSNSFLTSYPNFEPIEEDQEQFLTWFNFVGSISSNFILRAIASYKNGSTVTKDVAIGKTMSLYDSLVFSVNPVDLDLAILDLVKFSIQLFHSVSAVSPKRTYVLKSTPENVHDILYFNRFFAPHVLRLSGDWKKDIEISYERYENNDGLNQLTKDIEISYTAKSGFIRKAASEALCELYEKGVFWWIDGNYATLMLLDKKSWNVTASYSFLYIIDLAMTASRSKLSILNKAIAVNAIIEIPSSSTIIIPPQSED